MDFFRHLLVPTALLLSASNLAVAEASFPVGSVIEGAIAEISDDGYLVIGSASVSVFLDGALIEPAAPNDFLIGNEVKCDVISPTPERNTPNNGQIGVIANCHFSADRLDGAIVRAMSASQGIKGTVDELPILSRSVGQLLLNLDLAEACGPVFSISEDKINCFGG